MENELDILIKNARLRGKEGEYFDIGIQDGKVFAIEKEISIAADTEIDAHGNLVTESFVNPHLHLDKVYTFQILDEMALKEYHGESMGGAMSAIELASRVKDNYDQSWIIENVRKALELGAKWGNTHIRAFADIDSKARLEGVKALIQAREEYKGKIDIQVVAFPQDGVVREPGTSNFVREAMKMGADVVGGIPWIEYTDSDAQKHIDAMFAIAKEFDKDISMLVDDAGDSGLKTLEMLAVTTIHEGWRGRVLAHHARAMALYPKPSLLKLIALLKSAQIGVVSDPHTGPLHARVKELLENGVLVCLGQDDISDAYYPYGYNNLLEVAFLASHLLWMTTLSEMETLYSMITTYAARAMGLQNFTLETGNPANIVVLDVPNVLEALRFHRQPSHVVSHGKLIQSEIN